MSMASSSVRQGRDIVNWFTFELAANMQNDNDYYELNMVDGKVHIKGNDGVSLASGVNYYYKNYCHVMISEQANRPRCRKPSYR